MKIDKTYRSAPDYSKTLDLTSGEFYRYEVIECPYCKSRYYTDEDSRRQTCPCGYEFKYIEEVLNERKRCTNGCFRIYWF